MKGISLAIFVLLNLCAFESYACELTDEYKKLRSEMVKSTREARNSCEKSINNVNYWYALSQCVKMQLNGEIKPGINCSREAAHKPDKFKKHNVNSSYCQTFNVNSKEYSYLFNKAMKRRSVIKCKKPNE